MSYTKFNDSWSRCYVDGQGISQSKIQSKTKLSLKGEAEVTANTEVIYWHIDRRPLFSFTFTKVSLTCTV